MAFLVNVRQFLLAPFVAPFEPTWLPGQSYSSLKRFCEKHQFIDCLLLSLQLFYSVVINAQFYDTRRFVILNFQYFRINDYVSTACCLECSV